MPRTRRSVRGTCFLTAALDSASHLRTGHAKRLIIDSDCYAHGRPTCKCCAGWTANEWRTSDFYVSGPTRAIERVYVKERIRNIDPRTSDGTSGQQCATGPRSHIARNLPKSGPVAGLPVSPIEMGDIRDCIGVPVDEAVGLALDSHMGTYRIN